MSLQAVLFDMDGTVVDTDAHWLAAEQATFAHFDRPWTQQDHAALLGVPVVPATQYMVRRLEGAATFDEVRQLMMGTLVDLLRTHDIPWRPGAQELISDLRYHGIATGLVTASRVPLVTAVFPDVAALGFDVVVTGDDVPVTKPDPAPYLLAMDRLAASSATAVAVEDSPTGVASARAAGLATVVVPHVVSIEATAGVIPVGDFADVTVAFLRQIVDPAAGEASDRQM